MMAPNSDETGRLVPLGKCNKNGWTEDTLSREKQRPPIYNPEDYAISLKKWGKKPGTSPNLYSNLFDSHGSTISLSTPGDHPGKPSGTCSQRGVPKDYRNPMLTNTGSGEMTLRQFGTVSELLIKLRADLRLAFPSFVQEFISDPLDGITLLLDLLRSIQLSQSSSLPSNVPTPQAATPCANPGPPVSRVPLAVQRRALLDELACLQCLQCCCVRYSEGVQRMVISSGGLFTLAVCILSNVNKSRIIALELLTRACSSGEGHAPVSESLSTLRLRFGEPVRFQFLVGMLTSAGQCELLTAGLKFLNTFLETSGNLQRRLYIQAELEQAGFNIDIIKKIVNINSSSSDQVFFEIDKWEKSHIDIETFSQKVIQVEKENGNLKEKITLLERRVQILQEEKGILVSLEQCLKEKCCELQDEVTSLKSGKEQKNILSRDSSIKIGNTSPAEDEGISSSERSLTSDDIQQESLVYELYKIPNETITKTEEQTETIDDDEEETTIEEVIEELRNIINDAETEAYATEKKEETERRRIEEAQLQSKIQMRVDSNVLIEEEFDNEVEIIPSNLQPQPPRRTRSLVHLFIPAEEYEYDTKEMYFENETQFLSDESSDSLLSASKCQIQNNNRELLNTIMDARDKAILQEKRRQKKYDMMKNLKRNTSFQKNIPTIEINNQKTSLDGIYYATNYSNVPSTPVLKNKTKEQKIKSKSLDRIDDGLDSMVDIIVTNEKEQRLTEKSDSGHVTETSSNLYLKKENNKLVQKDKHRIFLPTNKFESQNINDSPFYFPRIQENSNNFMIKRGHINAGLYSGQILKQSPQMNKRSIVCSSNYRTSSRKTVSSRGKLTDLPSGLY